MAGNQGMYTYVDGRGRFAIEEMIAGEYELVLMKGFSPLPANRALLNPIKQTVTVTDGAVLQVVFVFEVGEKKDGQ